MSRKKIKLLDNVLKSNELFILVLGVFFVLVLGLVSNINMGISGITGASTYYDSVQCDWTWPQKVIVDGVSYSCDYNTPYCYSPGRSEGIARCCDHSESGGYSNCVDVGPEQTCTETGDIGIDYFIKGEVDDSETSWIGSHWTDSCEDGKIIEFFCDSNDNVQLVEHECEYGCTDGACNADFIPTCTETDSQIDYYVKGTVEDTETDWIGSSWTDVCSGDELTEFYCVGDNVELDEYTCEYGCTDGACNAEYLDTDDETEYEEEESEGLDIDELDDLDEDSIPDDEEIESEGVELDDLPETPSEEFEDETVWNDMCSGQPDPCSSYDKHSCEEHPGCSVYGFWLWKWCEGVPADCSNYLEEEMCEDQGCDWGPQ